MRRPPHHPEFEVRAALLGKKIRHRRDEVKLTELDLMERTGLSRTYLQRLMNGRESRDPETGEYSLPNPSIDLIWTLADALVVHSNYLTDPGRAVGETDP